MKKDPGQFTNEKGFSLILVMVSSVVVLGILGVSFKRTELGKKTSRNIEVRSEELLLWNQIRATLGSKQSCMKTFPLALANLVFAADATKVITVPRIKLSNDQVFTEATGVNESDSRMAVTKITLTNVTTPGTFYEAERMYVESSSVPGITTVVKTGVINFEITKFIKEGLNNKKVKQIYKDLTIPMKFSFRGGKLADCYGIEETHFKTQSTITEQCLAHNGTFNPATLECQFNGRPLFSAIDNNSAFCQMDKDRVKAQSYGVMNFCPDNNFWGGCVYKNKLLGSINSSIVISGKLPGATQGPITGTDTDFNLAVAIATLPLGIFGWCEEKKYYYCARCQDDGTIKYDLWKTKFDKKKAFSCGSKTKYYGIKKCP